MEVFKSENISTLENLIYKCVCYGFMEKMMIIPLNLHAFKILHYNNSLFFMFSILLVALQFVSLNMTYVLIGRGKDMQISFRPPKRS